MKVAIHQPQYLPYPGFFHKIGMVDAWVVMDDAQYDRRFTNRNKILAPSGPIWVSVPIVKSQKFGRNMDVRINNSVPWKEEHWKRISYSYRNAGFFGEYGPYFEGLYKEEHEFLCELDLKTAKKLIQWLGLRVEVILESELGVKGEATERLVNVCKAVGADTYVSGPGGRGYMDASLFADSGLGLEFSDYRPVPYRQRFGNAFVPDLSVVDMLFNLGPESGKLVAGATEADAPQQA